MSLKTFTLNQIRNRGPCYDPVKYLGAGWQGTALDILNHPSDCPNWDRLWVVFHPDCLHPLVLHRHMEYVINRGKELIADPSFKRPDSISVSDLTNLKAGHGAFSHWDKVWDVTDRKELVENLKTLIIEHEGEKHETYSDLYPIFVPGSGYRPTKYGHTTAKHQPTRLGSKP